MAQAHPSMTGKFARRCNSSSTTAARSADGARAANEQWYPDHAVFNATKDQLKAMPQFKYN
jgi:hypothetical protein